MSLPVSTTDSAPACTPVPSPCINICRMDPARGLCSGCWRSLDEIAAWSRLPDAARREVWRLIAERRGARQSE
ncbi:MAG: hypothetical protein RLY71_2225 [Pseudomonadota bacterium]|jgi:predicted Fe-S protein YdhL (DUF1289 family)